MIGGILRVKGFYWCVIAHSSVTVLINLLYAVAGENDDFAITLIADAQEYNIAHVFAICCCLLKYHI